jgi:DUF971 family protein
VTASRFPEPTEVRHERGARRVVVSWDDGHSSTYSIDYLRNWCPCALCQGHGATPKRLALEGQELQRIEPVGNYALSLVWGDGHDTGIYTFRWLRSLCPCDACGGEKR